MTPDFPLIVDVDTGVDDAVALAYATVVSRNLIGATTVAGNVPVEVATANTRNVLANLGRADIPVLRGASQPLVAKYQDATEVHGGNGLGGVRLRDSEREVDVTPGPAFIVQMARKYAGELVLVMTGPLTNLAIAINVRPEIVDKIARVVVMGGAYTVAGNVTSQAEFNVFVDPEAAAQVFAAPWKDLTLIGLDVTHQTVFSRSMWDAIPESADGSPWMVRSVMERTFTERGLSGFCLHDPLAMAVAFDPDLVAGPRQAVSVGVAGEERGKTTLQEGPGPLIATSVDVTGFLEKMAQALELPSSVVGDGFTRAI